MTVFPQYAKTTTQSVIDTITRNREGVLAFHAQAIAFAQAHGVADGTYYPSSFAGGHRLRAIGGDERPTDGRWKRGYSGFGWLPYKNNPLYADFLAVTFDEEEVPGLPSMLHGPHLPSGQQMIYSPQPFLWDGAVYVGFSGQPVEDGSRRPDIADGGWTEILASEYHAAREAFNTAATQPRAA